MMMRRFLIERAKIVGTCALVVLAVVTAACDKVPLTAPTNSTVTLTASAIVVPIGGTADLSAFVADPSGTPAQNGTMVRFTTNLGRTDPVEVQTRNGVATATFHAGDVSGVADVRATSGSAGSSTTAGQNGSTTSTGSNLVQITVGAAAVESVTLRANPASVPATGGTVELIASVIGVGGRLLSNVPVSFTTSEGQLAALLVPTNAAGEARTQLTTNATAKATAAAGTKTSNEVTVTRRDPDPVTNITLNATPDAASNLGQRWTFTATLTDGTTSTPVATRYDWDFGDGITLTTNGTSTAHVYTTGGVRRTVTVRATLSNGQTLSTSIDIIIAVLPP